MNNSKFNLADLFLIVVAFILLTICYRKNPSKIEFAEASLKKITEQIGVSNPLSDMLLGYAVNMSEDLLNKTIQRDDYILFSVFKFNYSPYISFSAYGVLGNFYFTEFHLYTQGTNNQIEQNNQTQQSENSTIDNHQSKPKTEHSISEDIQNGNNQTSRTDYLLRDNSNTKDYANVYYNPKYTLFDLLTDEPIYPDHNNNYSLYYATNEDKTPKYFYGSISELRELYVYKFKNLNNCQSWCNRNRNHAIKTTNPNDD